MAADFTSVPTVELLTRAADAAGKVATDQVAVIADFALTARVLSYGVAGPDHWRAVEATFRAGALHIEAYPDGPCLMCRGRVPCGTVLLLAPLAEQVLRDLGDTE